MPAFRRTAVPVRDILWIVFRHKGKAFTFFVLTMVATVSIILWYPRRYRSEAKLFVRLGRETVALDPTATTGQRVALMESRDNEINSVVEMLKSRGLAEKVVDQLGPQAILDADINDEPAEGASKESYQFLANLAAKIANIDPTTPRDRAIRRISQGLDVEAEKKSNVITVRYAAPTASKGIESASTNSYTHTS